MTGTQQLLVIYLSVFVTMLVCRVVPLFALKGRELSPAATEAISLIPAAAFAALVANDLFQPDLIADDPVAGIVPVIAALPVVVVARLKGSLILCAVVGMLSYWAVATLTGCF